MKNGVIYFFFSSFFFSACNSIISAKRRSVLPASSNLCGFYTVFNNWFVINNSFFMLIDSFENVQRLFSSVVSRDGIISFFLSF